MDHLGKQVLLELYNCEHELLNDSELIATIMVKAAEIAKATVVQKFFHHFSPFGVSGTVVIAESHINIHTWPEYNYIAIDIFTCGEELQPEVACAFLAESFKATSHSMSVMNRGSKREIAKYMESR